MKQDTPAVPAHDEAQTYRVFTKEVNSLITSIGAAVEPIADQLSWKRLQSKAEDSWHTLWRRLEQENVIPGLLTTSRIAFAMHDMLKDTVLQVPMPPAHGGMPCLLLPTLRDDIEDAASDHTGLALVQWLTRRIRKEAATQAAQHQTNRVQAAHSSSIIQKALAATSLMNQPPQPSHSQQAHHFRG